MGSLIFSLCARVKTPQGEDIGYIQDPRSRATSLFVRSLDGGSYE